MERLTRRIGPMIELQTTIKEGLSRLAQYEDSGLMPEDIGKLHHAKWISRRFGEEYKVVQCSLCHTTWDYDFYYCPNCGAKMDL